MIHTRHEVFIMELSKFIGFKIKELREANKKTQEDLAKALGTTRQSISRYENGLRKVGQDELFKLADYFNVSLDYFFPPIIDKTDIQKVYEQLSPDRQRTVYNFAEHQLDEQNNVNEESSVYVYGQTAADIPVRYVDRWYDTVSANVPEGADGALLVQEDSMEPLIKKNSIIFYKKQPIVENGEVAIIEIKGGEMTCKKFYFNGEKVILRSINGKFEDMIFEDGVRVIGKVIL